MIGFTQTNDMPGTFIPKRQIPRWLEPPPTNSDFCDAIDEIMKHEEHEDVILLDDALSSVAPLELDLDSFSDLLETQTSTPAPSSSTTNNNNNNTISNLSPSSSSSFTQPLNIYGITSFPLNNSNTNSTTTTSAYSSLGISPKFTTLSLNQQQQHPFSPPPSSSSSQDSNLLQRFVRSPVGTSTKTSLHPPPYVQQQERSVLGTSYPFELQINPGASDVKRFRSASMNDGPSQQLQQQQQQHQQQQCTQGLQLFDPYRLKSSPYINDSYYQNKTTTSTNTTTTTSCSSLSNDLASNTNAWPYVGCPRPASNSFSEFQNQQQQQQQTQRISTHLSASYGGSPSHYSLHPQTQEQRRQAGFMPDGNFPQQQQQQAATNKTNCTLYSLNQPTGGATPSPPPSIPLSRKRSSLVGFSVEEIKDDPISPTNAMEQQSEPDLWSDIEQNSSDHMQEDDNDGDDGDDGDDTSDDDTTTTISAGGHRRRAVSTLNPNQPTPSSLFWQYNVQAKGPKTKRILYLKERDPHLFREFSDPVYQIKLTQTKGQTLNKLRKGDGNDVTPNPMKLYQLGKQIRDLSATVAGPNAGPSSVYHGIYHVDQQSTLHQQQHGNNNDTAEVKKEKNKIASRACRLRKKAQHEANKLKLHGLNEEHKALIELIASIKLIVLKRLHDGHLNSPPSSPSESLEAAFDQLIASKYTPTVAGNTDGFVQAVVNDMERLYATKQQRSNSLNT